MRRQATPELNLKDSAARSLIDSCPERKRKFTCQPPSATASVGIQRE